MKKLLLALMLLFTVTVQAQSFDVDYKLPDQRFEVLQDNPVGKTISVEFKERELVERDSQYIIELLSWVRNHRYVNIAINKSANSNNYLKSLFTNGDAAVIQGKIISIESNENEVPAGSITTYTLFIDLITESKSSHYGPKIYELQAIEANSDFTKPTKQELENAFLGEEDGAALPSGNYTVCFFDAVYWGQGSDGRQVLHDRLIVKLDTYDNIIAAYHFTIEHIGTPELDIRESKNIRIELTSSMDINKLKLKGANASYIDDGILYF